MGNSPKKTRRLLRELEQQHLLSAEPGRLKPYNDVPYWTDIEAMRAHEPTGTDRHSRRYYSVICGECMAGRKPPGERVFEAYSLEPQPCADALGRHYQEKHPDAAR